MNDAQMILQNKAFMKKIMDRCLPWEQSQKIWERAEEELEEILDRYSDLPKKVRAHTYNYIFPSAAVYIAAKEVVGEKKAYRIIEKSSVLRSTNARESLKKIMRIPFMPDLFVAIWDPMTKSRFGSESGFKNRSYPKVRGEFRMDILSCPYNKYFTELGCPELTKIFCDNDQRVYGDLPGLEFVRAGTIGKGFDKCDFCIRRKK